MEEKNLIKETGEIVLFGPLCARKFDGQKDFDKYYIDRQVKQVVKKTGEGEDDFILVDKIIESKRDIQETIQSQVGDVGIEAYMKPYIMSGEEVPEVKVTDDIQDFTEMPDTLADAILLGESSRKKFEALPKELKGKMTYEEFMTNFTQSMFDSFIEKITPKPEKEEGEK